jgi:AraC family transcriptional regulator
MTFTLSRHNSIQPKIEHLKEKKLPGMQMSMSLSENTTGELWRNFMPVQRKIKNSIGSELYSVEVYFPEYFNHFNPWTMFDKLAAVEVTGYVALPAQLETITLADGLYAVCVHKGHKGPESIGLQTY